MAHTTRPLMSLACISLDRNPVYPLTDSTALMAVVDCARHIDAVLFLPHGVGYRVAAYSDSAACAIYHSHDWSRTKWSPVMRFAENLDRARRNPPMRLGEAIHCGVSMAFSPNALNGGARRVGGSGSRSESSLNMGEWYGGLCISLRPNESNCGESIPAGELSASGLGSSTEDIETVSKELECAKADRETKSSRLARSSQSSASPS